VTVVIPVKLVPYLIRERESQKSSEKFNGWQICQPLLFIMSSTDFQIVERVIRDVLTSPLSPLSFLGEGKVPIYRNRGEVRNQRNLWSILIPVILHPVPLKIFLGLYKILTAEFNKIFFCFNFFIRIAKPVNADGVGKFYPMH